MILNTCLHWNLKCNRTEHTGVWINESKIAAIGVQVSRFVSFHGFALNCNVDLNWFEHFEPCGIKNKSVTSLTKETNQNISVEQVKSQLMKEIELGFSCRLVEKCN